MSLEGNEAFSLTSVQKADWVKEDPARAVNHLRTRIDPEKAEGVEGVLVFDIEGEVAALHIRNSIAEFVPDPDAHYRKRDASITVSDDEFAAYFRGEISADDLTKRAKTDGEAAKLIGVFDSYVHVPMYP